MKTFVIALLLCLSVFTFADDQPSDVIELTSTNFFDVIKEHPVILIEFYAPWCGHCKKLAPEYEKAATELKGIAPIAKVDADAADNKGLAARFGIQGFPTIKLFRNGEVDQDYQSERTAAAIVSYMKKQILPAVSTLTTSAEVQDFSTKDRVVIVGFFQDESQLEPFKAIAEKLRNKFIFGAVVGNSDVNKEFGVESTPAAVLFKSFDERKNILSSDKFSDLEEFITSNSVPLIDEIGPHNYKNYIESGLPVAYLFVEPAQTEQYLDIIKSIAEETKGKMSWVWIDWSKYAKHAERLGLSGKVVPAVAIEKMQEGLHYAFDETAQITAEVVKEWVNKFLTGELQPTIKSEEIPATNDGPVKVIVAKSFNDIVLDNTKDVLLEFYAPWCGHCKSLAPTYEKLGEAFSSVPSVVIAKIDATANDVDPKYGIRGFPTIKFFPADKKNTPIDFNGERTLDGMKSFVEENASIKFELPTAKDEL
jgi:protein disulfide-isomerase A1